MPKSKKRFKNRLSASIPAESKIDFPVLLCFIMAIVLLHINPALCEEIKLRNGDVLNGKIIERSEDGIIMEHPILGTITIPADLIIPPSQPETVEKAEKPKWVFSFVFGGTVTNDDEGEKIAYNSRFNATRETEKVETGLRLSYVYEIKNEKVDDNNFTAILNQTWFKQDSPWQYFGTARYDYDDFRSWRQRIQTHGGMGYELFDKEDLHLTPMAGLGFRKEYESEEQPLSIEALLGAELFWRHESGRTFSYEVLFYPALNNDEWRLVNIVDWKVPFGKTSRFNFNTHLDHEYATDPDPGFPYHNIRLTWGLQWEF